MLPRVPVHISTHLFRTLSSTYDHSKTLCFSTNLVASVHCFLIPLLWKLPQLSWIHQIRFIQRNKRTKGTLSTGASRWPIPGEWRQGHLLAQEPSNGSRCFSQWPTELNALPTSDYSTEAVGLGWKVSALGQGCGYLHLEFFLVLCSSLLHRQVIQRTWPFPRWKPLEPQAQHKLETFTPS